MRRVNVSPPRGIFHAHLLRGDAFDAACMRVDVDELCNRRKCHYFEFDLTHLLQRVGPDASTSQAPVRALNSHVSFIFV